MEVPTDQLDLPRTHLNRTRPQHLQASDDQEVRGFKSHRLHQVWTTGIVSSERCVPLPVHSQASRLGLPVVRREADGDHPVDVADAHA